MNLTVQRADLARALTHAMRVVERRNTIPILAHVALFATPGELVIRATDLDIEVEVTVPADVTTAGSTAVDAARLSDIAKKVGNESVSLVLDDGRLVAKSGRSRVSLPTLSPDDMPRLTIGEFAAEFDIDLADFVAPIAYAQCEEETRIYLKGIFLHATSEGLVAVATDGHKLALRKAESVGDFPASILPKKLIAALPKGAGKLALSSNLARFEVGDVTLTSKLIDGTYPDYQRVVPTGNPQTVRVEKAAITKAVDLAMSISETQSRLVRMDISPGGIALSSRSNVGDVAEEIAADYAGEPFAIGFNGRYVVETLAAFDTAEVEIHFNDGYAPALVTNGGDVTAVIMPIRV